MEEQRQDDQLEPIHNSSVLIQGVALTTIRERWTIETGGERGSKRSVLAAWHDDDDDYINSSSQKDDQVKFFEVRKRRRTHFRQAAVVSILLYGCTTWTLIQRLEKKLDDNYTRMLRAILNESWRQHATRHQIYGHLPPITKTIQVRRTRHAWHCWRSKDELLSDVLLFTPTYDQAKAGRPARTYIQQNTVGEARTSS